jgi:hypothetical protein
VLLHTDGSPFATGRARFSDHDPATEKETAKIYVKVQPEGLEAVILAQLDTGSPWTVLARDYAEALALFGGEGQAITLNIARYGTIRGRLEKANITLLADEDEGQSLDVQQATVFVSMEWPGGTFLGYSGLLEKVRFALDPQKYLFYFGPAGEP